jgi:hypothetical protein
MSTTYSRGDVVSLDGTPAVVLAVIEGKGADTLLVSRFPGMSAYIGAEHSGLSALEGAGKTFADRVDEIRAYYGVTEGDAEPWVSRVFPDVRGATPDAFPERIGTHGMDYSPRLASSLEAGAL